MNEQLIAGYAEHAGADEFTADAQGDVPATTPVSIAISVSYAASATIAEHC